MHFQRPTTEWFLLPGEKIQTSPSLGLIRIISQLATLVVIEGIDGIGTAVDRTGQGWVAAHDAAQAKTAAGAVSAAGGAQAAAAAGAAEAAASLESLVAVAGERREPEIEN